MKYSRPADILAGGARIEAVKGSDCDARSCLQFALCNTGACGFNTFCQHAEGESHIPECACLKGKAPQMYRVSACLSTLKAHWRNRDIGLNMRRRSGRRVFVPLEGMCARITRYAFILVLLRQTRLQRRISTRKMSVAYGSVSSGWSYFCLRMIGNVCCPV